MQGARTYTQSHSKKGDFVTLIKTNWILILGVIVGGPILYRYVKEQLLLNKEQNEDIKAETQILLNQNPLTRQQQADKITLDKNVQRSAENLAHHLGTKYSDAGNWYDIFNPRGWTENDNEVLTILQVQVRNIHLVERLYFEVYSKRRNLKDDVNKLLDKPQLEKLKAYYKKYQKVW